MLHAATLLREKMRMSNSWAQRRNISMNSEAVFDDSGTAHPSAGRVNWNISPWQWKAYILTENPLPIPRCKESVLSFLPEASLFYFFYVEIFQSPLIEFWVRNYVWVRLFHIQISNWSSIVSWRDFPVWIELLGHWFRKLFDSWFVYINIFFYIARLSSLFPWAVCLSLHQYLTILVTVAFW